MYQPKEKAGSMEHTIRQLIEKSMEYNIQVWIAFIDFKNAFESIQPCAIEPI